MQVAAVVLGLLILVVVLWETFETMVLPRSVTRKIRLSRIFFVSVWRMWVKRARHIRDLSARERYLGVFGPLILLLLIVFWGLLLIYGFALIHWGLGSELTGSIGGRHATFLDDLYMSGTTFVTLGMGDVTPATGRSRIVAVIEAGIGFGFFAIVISYLPVLYQSFSRREVGISTLDARAGSPPSAGEMLRRHSAAGRMEEMVVLLHQWEHWCSDILESHLSYPVLAFYRSQHDREAWLAALGAIIDVCALIELGFEGDPPWQDRLIWQARMTFAMARHALVDLSLVLLYDPRLPAADRLDEAGFRHLVDALSRSGLHLRSDKAAEAHLTETRLRYEPYLIALSRRLLVNLPDWIPDQTQADNWQVSAWDRHF